MARSRKKVLVRMLAGTVVPGYLPSASFASGAPAAPDLDLLDLAGRLHPVSLPEIRWISYVREFNLSADDPEQLSRRTFLARPRSEGLWLRLHLSPTEIIEGLLRTDLSLLDSLLVDRGLFLTPPDPRSNTTRLFVPRSAIIHFETLSVVTTPSRRKPVIRPETLQTDLFPLP